jgi:hypothetical protein
MSSQATSEVSSATTAVATPARQFDCCICNATFPGSGNNAEPLKDGECCDDCNKKVLIARYNAVVLEGDGDSTPPSASDGDASTPSGSDASAPAGSDASTPSGSGNGSGDGDGDGDGDGSDSSSKSGSDGTSDSSDSSDSKLPSVYRDKEQDRFDFFWAGGDAVYDTKRKVPGDDYAGGSRRCELIFPHIAWVFHAQKRDVKYVTYLTDGFKQFKNDHKIDFKLGQDISYFKPRVGRKFYKRFMAQLKSDMDSTFFALDREFDENDTSNAELRCYRWSRFDELSTVRDFFTEFDGSSKRNKLFAKLCFFRSCMLVASWYDKSTEQYRPLDRKAICRDFKLRFCSPAEFVTIYRVLVYYRNDMFAFKDLMVELCKDVYLEAVDELRASEWTWSPRGGFKIGDSSDWVTGNTTTSVKDAASDGNDDEVEPKTLSFDRARALKRLKSPEVREKWLVKSAREETLIRDKFLTVFESVDSDIGARAVERFHNYCLYRNIDICDTGTLHYHFHTMITKATGEPVVCDFSMLLKALQDDLDEFLAEMKCLSDGIDIMEAVIKRESKKTIKSWFALGGLDKNCDADKEYYLNSVARTFVQEQLLEKFDSESVNSEKGGLVLELLRNYCVTANIDFKSLTQLPELVNDFMIVANVIKGERPGLTDLDYLYVAISVAYSSLRIYYNTWMEYDPSHELVAQTLLDSVPAAVVLAPSDACGVESWLEEDPVATSVAQTLLDDLTQPTAAVPQAPAASAVFASAATANAAVTPDARLGQPLLVTIVDMSDGWHVPETVPLMDTSPFNDFEKAFGDGIRKNGGNTKYKDFRNLMKLASAVYHTVGGAKNFVPRWNKSYAAASFELLDMKHAIRLTDPSFAAVVDQTTLLDKTRYYLQHGHPDWLNDRLYAAFMNRSIE